MLFPDPNKASDDRWTGGLEVEGTHWEGPREGYQRQGGCCYQAYQKQCAGNDNNKNTNSKTKRLHVHNFRQIVPDSALKSHAVPRPSWKSLGRGEC